MIIAAAYRPILAQNTNGDADGLTNESNEPLKNCKNPKTDIYIALVRYWPSLPRKMAINAHKMAAPKAAAPAK